MMLTKYKLYIPFSNQALNNKLSCLKEAMPMNDVKKYTKAEIMSIDAIYPFQVVMFCDCSTISLASTTSTSLATHNHNHGLNASRIIEYATIRID